MTQTKKLYILITDGGDGSYSNSYTFDRDVIDRQSNLYDNDKLEHGDTGVDGDGFHWSELNVPAGSTYESLGITYFHSFHNYS